MIIDANVSLDRHRFTVERALQVLSASKIERAVVFADSKSAELTDQNKYVLQVSREHGLFPFYYVGGNPFTDTRPDVLELPNDISEYAGIRWHRWVGAAVDREGVLDEDELEWAVNLMESPEFEAFAAAAAHYNLPVLFEESFGVTLEFVLRYPSLDIIIPHLGARNGGQTRILAALWDTPHVYFDTSLALLDETALARLGTERIFFGSAYPQGDPEAEIDKVDRLPIPEEVQESIYGENLLSLLADYERVHI